MPNGFVSRNKGKIKAHQIYVGSGGLLMPSYDGLAARAGGGQALATQLNYGLNRLATVATLNDSAQLPNAVSGSEVVVVNDGAAAAKIYAKNGSSDTIDGVSGATGVTLTNAKRTLFKCLTDGKWISFGMGVSA